MTEQTYTVKEVAGLLRTCDTTIRRWIKAKKVKAHKMSEAGHWRVSQAEVDRLTGTVAHGV